jgi:ribokinase
MANKRDGVAILGIFVADLAFRAGRMPLEGETILGSGFAMGPGGKGSNQAVAAARLGAKVKFISRLGQDAFGDIALSAWKAESIEPHVAMSADRPTGAAFIYVNDATGQNATISPSDVDSAAAAIASSVIFVTQLEQPVAAAKRGLEIARENGVITILNPAPAVSLDPAIFSLCDYVTPNETEAAALTGIAVRTLDDARRAGDILLKFGAGTALVTLGEKGALFHRAGQSELVPALAAGPVVETTGAGDAFNGGFAAALAKGMEPLEAAHFACAVAGISVTRPGTAPSMPRLAEVEALRARAFQTRKR